MLSSCASVIASVSFYSIFLFVRAYSLACFISRKSCTFFDFPPHSFISLRVRTYPLRNNESARDSPLHSSVRCIRQSAVLSCGGVRVLSNPWADFLETVR